MQGGGRSESRGNPPRRRVAIAIAPAAHPQRTLAATDESPPVCSPFGVYWWALGLEVTRCGRLGGSSRRLSFTPLRSSCTLPSRRVRTITFFPARLKASCCRSVDTISPARTPPSSPLHYRSCSQLGRWRAARARADARRPGWPSPAGKRRLCPEYVWPNTRWPAPNR